MDDAPSKKTVSIPLPQESPDEEPRELSRPPPREVPPLTGLAVISLVFGIVSMVSALLLIPAVCAVIAGHLAIHKIRHANRELGGHRLAVTGLIMGYVSILIFSVMMVAFIVLWPRFGPKLKDFVEERKARQAMRHATELYLVCERYARDHGDKYPAQWDDLEKGYSNRIDLEDWLQSVHTDDPVYDPAFELVKHERPVFESAQHRVAVIQERAPPEVGMVVVMFADGHSELVPNPERE